MRRPLAVAGSCFILVLLIIQLLFPAGLPDYSSIDGKHITVRGVLDRIEHKQSDGQVRTIWYVKDVQIYAHGMSTGTDETDTPGPNNVAADGYEAEIPDKSTILCYMDEDVPKMPVGACVVLSGRVRNFESARNPGQFDMKKYYALDHIIFSMTAVNITSVDTSHITLLNRLKNRLSVIRDRIGAMCDLCFMPDDSSVIRAMLLGDKSAISPDMKSLYARNGISHILAISGLHISMIGEAIVLLMRKARIPRSVSSITVVILMVMYGMMTGMAASAFRAVVMFSLRQVAELVHRTYDMATALVIAACLVLIEQPAYLFYSGFQFSFGAITAVLLILPVLSEVLPKLVAGGAAVTVVTLPVYLYNYYYYPVISVILNLYIIPLMSVLLACAIIAIAGCAVYIPLGRLIAIPVHLILALYEWSCRISDLMPYNRFVTGQPSAAAIAVYVLIVGSIIFFSGKLANMQIILGMLFACVMLTTNLRTGIDICLIDVGQGDGIYITDNCGTDILIDGGSSDVSDVGTYRIGPFLYSQGVSEVDAAFITHLDADHYNGILEMLSDSGTTMPHIKALYLTSSSVKMRGEAYDALVEAAAAGHTEVYTVTAGDVFESGALRLSCLYPNNTCNGIDTNNESLVLDMEYAGSHRPLGASCRSVHILFTGDLGGEGETAVTEKLREYMDPEDLLILKCAHHGSKNSTYEPFIEASGPDLVIISAGIDNPYGHPNTETIERLDSHGIPHFCTIDYGELDVHIHGDEIEVIPYIKDD